MSQVSRLLLRFVCSLATLFLVPLSALQGGEGKPNIVLFFADDLGWTGLNCFGSDLYETPNLDALAATGMRFTDAYAACTVCSPSRAALLTGYYPARLRLTSFIPGQERPYAKMSIPEWTMGLGKEYTTLAEALRAGGYRTSHIGKWHLNFPNEPADPREHGFDSSQGKPAGTRGYYLTEPAMKKVGASSNYATDYLAELAAREVMEDSGNPFFLYFAFHVPHTPIQGRADLVKYFAGKVEPGATHNNPVYAAMVKSMDMAVGRVLGALEASGKAEDTLVIFTSDNGGLTQRYGKHDNFTENLPLRRGKGSAYEGGVRVPTIVR
ncbi:MAG: sulfatase-like hydrolase/transferase, partial [Verrucomicrobiales bacterium]